jgi:alpha/beta superfamily hydrolase
MAEIPVMIPVDDFLLEGLHDKGNDIESAIICHPHPLYGGSMDNNVVIALKGVLGDRGWGTLRFNFRGVGRSGGSYAEGDGADRDLMAAASYLISNGAVKLHVSAYSFGAWIALRAVKRGLEPDSLILVSPPLDFLEFQGLKLPPKPCLITLGDRDAFCAVGSLREWLHHDRHPTTDPQVELFSGCDHFYRGQEMVLSTKVSAFIRNH